MQIWNTNADSTAGMYVHFVQTIITQRTCVFWQIWKTNAISTAGIFVCFVEQFITLKGPAYFGNFEKPNAIGTAGICVCFGQKFVTQGTCLFWHIWKNECDHYYSTSRIYICFVENFIDHGTCVQKLILSNCKVRSGESCIIR